MEVQGDQVVVKFDHVGAGLNTFDVAEVRGFAVAGEDKKWHWAKGTVTGNDTVTVTCPEVKAPVAVRYAWADNPVCNLFSKEGLPTTPFRSDDWPGVTNNANGTLTVPSGTPAGTYPVTYQICEVLNLTNCDTATATVVVSSVTVDAVNDNGAGVNGTVGGQSMANVLANDSLDGTTPVLLANVNLTQVSTTNPGVTLNPLDGSVNVAAGFFGWEDAGRKLLERQRQIHSETGKKPFLAAIRYETTAQTIWGTKDSSIVMLNKFVSHYTVMQKKRNTLEALVGMDSLILTTEKYPDDPMEYANFDTCEKTEYKYYRLDERSRTFYFWFCQNFKGVKY